MALQIIILAAGKGKRMLSDHPKVLHELGGIPLLEHVVNTATLLHPKNIFVVHGNGGDEVKQRLHYLNVTWVEQKEQLGTGHAVLQALPYCQDSDQVLILYGDVPLISKPTLELLQQETPRNGLGLIVAELSDPTGFGRILRNELGSIVAIIEHKDASEEQHKINEINTGILTASAGKLKSWLPRLNNRNNQHEYYLTDVVAAAVDEGLPVGGVKAPNEQEVAGVNDRWQLTQLERAYQYRLAQRLTEQGVTIMDPHRLDLRGYHQIDEDVVLDVNVMMEGKVVIGKNCNIGPNVYLKDVVIADNVTILANSHIEGAQLDSHSQIGPFARIRPQTVVGSHAKVGNFVELKKTQLGSGTKVSHLTYLGDAIIGQKVNIGAGTITCNYDGVSKYQPLRFRALSATKLAALTKWH